MSYVNLTCTLYIVLFLHQTTTLVRTAGRYFCCISYYSYIKPQQRDAWPIFLRVVYRTIPTSNHNPKKIIKKFKLLYIVLFLHQTTTHQIRHRGSDTLYIVLFLHQTTTMKTSEPSPACCISYYSYIKPQLKVTTVFVVVSCISYYSYIKPQLPRILWLSVSVVYRTIPTSNHNWRGIDYHFAYVVYRTIPTSNHNVTMKQMLVLGVVYRTIPTSNHN